MTGAPFSGDQSGRSLLWSRTAAPSLADAPKLALLADYMPPRVFYLANNFVPSSTLSMSVYFHASADEYAALGDDFTLVEVNGRRVGEGYWDHSAAFWSRHGALIATTEQISIHRG